MFNLFDSRNPKAKLHKKYEYLPKEAYVLSKTDRTASDQKTAEAKALMREVEGRA